MAKEVKTSLKAEQTQGKIEILRPSKLAEEGRTGVICRGVLEKKEPNKFNKAKNDYFIRGEDGTLYILNDTKSLTDQLNQDGVIGLTIEVVYNGKKETKSGRGFHSFEVFAIRNA